MTTPEALTMKKLWTALFLIGISALLLAGCGTARSGGDQASDKLSVVASFYPMYDFAIKIGGDRVTVETLVPPGAEPHDWEPSPPDIVRLENADVFIYNGAGMERWASKVLAALENKDLVVVEASRGIPLLEGGHDDHEEAEAEETGAEDGYDPHVWLNPMHAKTEMAAIKNALVQADPAGRDYYEANYLKYAEALDQLDSDFRQALSALPNRDIIVSHAAFGYLCQAYGLNQIGIDGLSAESEPDPARMAEIIDFAREHQVKVIFFEELISPKVAQVIAEAVQAETAVLNPLGGLSDAQLAAGADYFSVMRENLAALKAALS
jgi:zinc transport system substrate-binding protein